MYLDRNQFDNFGHVVQCYGPRAVYPRRRVSNYVISLLPLMEVSSDSPFVEDAHSSASGWFGVMVRGLSIRPVQDHHVHHWTGREGNREIKVDDFRLHQKREDSANKNEDSSYTIDPTDLHRVFPPIAAEDGSEPESNDTEPISLVVRTSICRVKLNFCANS